MVLLICSFLFSEQRSAEQHALEKDQVSCLSITKGHTVFPAVELRHLRYFVAVAEMENVSRAALKLHVSQPALSRQIRDLEDELGFSLLERTAKSVRLTDAGRKFLDDARLLLQQAGEAVTKARSIAGKHDLLVGDWPLATGRIMPALLRAYQQAMPNVHVRLHDWPVDQNIAGVREGRLQLAIIVVPLKAKALDDLLFQELMSMRASLAASCDHPFMRRQSVPLADAAREPFIGLVREKYPHYMEYMAAIFATVNEKPRIVEEHDGWAGLFSAVRAGTGVALYSDAFSYMFGDRVKLLRLRPEPKRVPIGIITRKERLSPALEKFCQCAREAFAVIR
jgi:LysR family transcriptional regulator, benzoate and cis,cis-muconate-responsive activator of ben and cat genes